MGPSRPLMLSALVVANLCAVRAGGPSDMANPDCADGLVQVAPADCIDETSTNAYKRLSIFADGMMQKPEMKCAALFDGNKNHTTPISNTTDEFCSSGLQYRDTVEVQTWVQEEYAAGKTVAEVDAKLLAIGNIEVADFCPLLCGRCQPYSPPPPPPCVDDPLGILSDPNWPFAMFIWDCASGFTNVAGGNCDEDVSGPTGRPGYTFRQMCPVTCNDCPPPPPPPGCQVCPEGTWASDLDSWPYGDQAIAGLAQVKAGVRMRCDPCPKGTYRVNGYTNTRCQTCAMGSKFNSTGATKSGDCDSCRPAGCTTTGQYAGNKMGTIFVSPSGFNFAEEALTEQSLPVHVGSASQPMELGMASLESYTDQDADMNTTIRNLIGLVIHDINFEENETVPATHMMFALKNCKMVDLEMGADSDGCDHGSHPGLFGQEMKVDVKVRIYAEASLNPEYATTVARDLSSRNRTATQIIWDVPHGRKTRHSDWDEYGIEGHEPLDQEGYDAMPLLQTPDISSILQELVNTPGWGSGSKKVHILIEHLEGSGTRWTGMDMNEDVTHKGMIVPALVWDHVKTPEEWDAYVERCGGYGEEPGRDPAKVDHPEYPELGRTKCYTCQPGTFDHDLNPATPCVKCPSGTYNNVERATTCTLCPLYSVSTPGSRFRSDCIPLMSVEWDECEPCKSLGGNCSKCPRGYVGSSSIGLYSDYDECSHNNGGCDPRVVCTNSEGSWSCGDCPPGLQYNEQGRCILPVIERNSTDAASNDVETVVPTTTVNFGVPITALEGTAVQRADFIDQLKTDLAASLGVDKSLIVISNLVAAAAGSGRRLQAGGTVAANFDFSVLGHQGVDAMDSLSQQLADPTSMLMQSPTTSTLTTISPVSFACPAGKRMGDGETVCRSCGPTSFTTDGLTCVNCVVGFGANTVANSVGDSCQCLDNYYDSAAQLSVCFDDGFNQEEFDSAVASFEARTAAGTTCQVCPTDAHGNNCFSCESGQKPTVLAGYIHAQLPDTANSSSRRSLAVISDINAQMQVHRCNNDMKLGSLRCPASPDFPGQCSKGYAGIFCNSCDEDFGMKGGTTTCEPCDDSKFTAGAGFVLAGVIVFFALVVLFFVKYWAIIPGQHLIKSSFVPGRILVTYFQITAQLGDVLNFPYPPAFAAVMEVIAPIIDFWGMLFRVMGVSPECLGLQGFTNSWIMRVAVLPFVLCVVVLLIFSVERCTNSAKAYSHAKGNLFLAVFFCYPTVCSTAFRAFMCKALTLTATVLEADDKVLCEDTDHRVIQGLSLVVTIVFAIGLPLALLFGLTKKARDYARDEQASNAGLTRRVAEELQVDDEKAEYIIRDLVIGADYGFVMDAYDPKYLYWEAVDMIRKLALVGLVLVAGRGSVGQLVIALLLAFVFFALQVRLCPYKIDEDNTLRAATELQVFLIIVAALVLQKTDISRESMDLDFYNWLLVLSFIVLVPGAFVIAVISKVRFLKKVVSATAEGELADAKLAFDRTFVGLANANDTVLLKSYIDSLRLELASANFTNVITGAKWKTEHPDTAGAEGSTADKTLAPLVQQDMPTPEEEPTPPPSADAAIDGAEDAPDSYYGKFDSGFEGTFADMGDFYGGLDKLIGDPRKDIMQAMEDEHCGVAEGYGWSDGQFETSSYRVVTTPRKEWFFVTSPATVGDMSAGIDRDTGRARGFRTKISPYDLLENAAELITKSFVLRGFDVIITPAQIRALPLLLEEIIALRLYTGPMFELYNTALRAYGCRPRGIVPAYSLVYPGEDVTGRFTTTLHALNSAVLKISRLQPAMQVYRGISRMKLPKAFTEKNEFNVRGGVEYGFMSTTADKNVAMMFAKDGDTKTASTLVTANMGMISRGASLDWLSQYPHEQEILLPPLTAMEVVDITDFEDEGKFQIRKLTVRLDTNMMSMTLEKLLGMRKKQVAELCGIASRDIVKHDVAADIPSRAYKLKQSAAALETADSQQFNDNKFFLDQSRMIQDLMPQIGDCIQVLTKHTKDVYGLVPTDSKVGFASSSWDGTVKVWAADDRQVYDCTSEERLPAASLALDYLSEEHVVSTQLDGCLAVQSCTQPGLPAHTIVLTPELHADRSGCVSVAVLRGDLTEQCNISMDGSPPAKQEPSADTPKLMVSGSQAGRVVLWDLANELEPKEVQSLGSEDGGHHDVVRALVWGNNGKDPCVVSGSFDSQIIVWRLNANTGLLELEKRLCDHSCSACSKLSTAHKGAVTSLVYIGAYGDSQEILASGSEDGNVKLWDLDSGHVGPIRNVGNFSRGVCSLAWLDKPQHSGFGPVGWLASGLGDNTIAISQPDTGTVLAILRGHDGPVHALLWLQSKGWLVSGSADSTVRTWRVRSDANAVHGALLHPESKVGSAMLTKMKKLRSSDMDEGVPPEA